MCKSLSEALSVSLVIAGHMTTKETIHRTLDNNKCICTFELKKFNK